jgi:hypothetical protein
MREIYKNVNNSLPVTRIFTNWNNHQPVIWLSTYTLNDVCEQDWSFEFQDLCLLYLFWIHLQLHGKLCSSFEDVKVQDSFLEVTSRTLWSNSCIRASVPQSQSAVLWRQTISMQIDLSTYPSKVMTTVTKSCSENRHGKLPNCLLCHFLLKCGNSLKIFSLFVGRGI